MSHFDNKGTYFNELQKIGHELVTNKDMCLYDRIVRPDAMTGVRTPIPPLVCVSL